VVLHAGETLNVVATCVGSELLKSMLPHLLEQLELCQKSLSVYLGTLACVGASAQQQHRRHASAPPATSSIRAA
jgi:hypothetical protein